MAVQFVTIDRDTPYLLPPSIQDCLPQDHLTQFVVEMVDRLDMRGILGVYAGKGKKAYHPEMLVALLFYGYATGTFSSRKLEKAGYDSIAYRYISITAPTLGCGIPAADGSEILCQTPSRGGEFQSDEVVLGYRRP